KVNAAAMASDTARAGRAWNRRMWSVLSPSRRCRELEGPDVRRADIDGPAGEVDAAVVGDRNTGIHRRRVRGYPQGQRPIQPRAGVLRPVRAGHLAAEQGVTDHGTGVVGGHRELGATVYIGLVVDRGAGGQRGLWPGGVQHVVPDVVLGQEIRAHGEDQVIAAVVDD